MFYLTLCFLRSTKKKNDDEYMKRCINRLRFGCGKYYVAEENKNVDQKVATRAVIACGG